ncbi:MAG: VCBS repeat-containing protein, partial [Acidobacteriota bacterium]
MTRSSRTTFLRPLGATLFGALLLAAPVLGGGDWIGFNNFTTTLISADNGAVDPVGTTDEFEKDVVAADFDKDGDADLVVVRKVRFSSPGGKRNALFMNEGGVFTDRTATLAPDMLDETDDRDVIAVDVDGDTWLDLVTATTFSDQPRVYMNLGTGLGNTWLGFDFEATDNRIVPFGIGPKFCAVVAGDVDNDLDQDLFFVDYDNDLEDRLLINDGNGFFTDETTTRMTPAMSASAFGTDAQIVDLNDDGWNDIVKLSTLSDDPNSIRVLYNAPVPILRRHARIVHGVISEPELIRTNAALG